MARSRTTPAHDAGLLPRPSRLRTQLRSVARRDVLAVAAEAAQAERARCLPPAARARLVRRVTSRRIAGRGGVVRGGGSRGPRGLGARPRLRRGRVGGRVGGRRGGTAAVQETAGCEFVGAFPENTKKTGGARTAGAKISKATSPTCDGSRTPSGSPRTSACPRTRSNFRIAPATSTPRTPPGGSSRCTWPPGPARSDDPRHTRRERSPARRHAGPSARRRRAGTRQGSKNTPANKLKSSRSMMA